MPIFPNGTAFLGEGMVIGPDGKLYVCDGFFDRILRMNQDGTQVEVIYDQATTSPAQCGGQACPTGPEGPTFLNGDLYFNTRQNGPCSALPICGLSGPGEGVWKIPIVGVPVGGPFPLPVQLLQTSIFGEGTTFDANDNLLIVDSTGNRVLKSAPPYNTVSPLINPTPLGMPAAYLRRLQRDHRRPCLHEL